MRFFLLSTADDGSGDEGTDGDGLGCIRAESGLRCRLEVESGSDGTCARVSSEIGDTSAVLLELTWWGPDVHEVGLVDGICCSAVTGGVVKEEEDWNAGVLSMA